MSYLHLSIFELHQLLLDKKVTPLDLVKEAIESLKNDKNNAIEYLMEKESIEMASNLGEVEKDNIFFGIPFGIKDNFSTKDVFTCASSEILKGYVPVYNATVIDKLIEKKAIPVAKLTLDELAMGGTGTTGHLGMTFNPYDGTHTRLIGGSSCGSAAVVSAGVLPFSLGSDTGDSVRKPASYAGLVGLKPTWSRISRFGLFPFTPSLDAVGFFTRSVRESASLLNVLAGEDKNDFTSSKKPVEDYTLNLSKDIKGKKIAVIKEIIESCNDKDVKNKFDECINYFKEMGAIINYVSIDKDLLRTIFITYYIISCAEATSNNANLDGIKFGTYYDGENYEESMRKARSVGFSDRIKKRFILGSYSLLKENQNDLYLRATKNRRKIVDAFNKVLNDNDVIFLPAAPSIAPKKDAIIDKKSDEYLILDNYMCIANFGGYPSLTIPAGFKDNMPFGFNFTGKPFDESNVFNIASKLEDKLGLKGLSIRSKK